MADCLQYNLYYEGYYEKVITASEDSMGVTYLQRKKLPVSTNYQQFYLFWKNN